MNESLFYLIAKYRGFRTVCLKLACQSEEEAEAFARFHNAIEPNVNLRYYVREGWEALK